MAYTLSNKCAKNCCKWTILVQAIIEDVATCFFWNTAAAAAFISVNSIFMKHQYKKNGTTEYCGTDRLFPALISDLDTMKSNKIKYTKQTKK